MSQPRIHPLEVFSQPLKHGCVVDVRTAAEAQAERVEGCLHLPLHELTAERLNALREQAGKTQGPVYLLCQAGRRAEMAAEQLAGQGLGQVIVIDGGINAVKAANIPLLKGAGHTISLERQVRIAAGALVVLGALLGTLVHPGFFGLCAFVGAGLVFAGISDLCLMGTLIAKMPWNR